MWTTTTLEDSAFETINGLWKGKTEPFVRAKVLRNTNFRNDGILDFSDVAELDVEARALSKKKLIKGDIIIERSGGGPKQPVGHVCLFDIETNDNFSLSNFTTALRIRDRKKFLPLFVCYYLLYLYRNGHTENLQRATTGIRNLDFTSYLKTEIPVLAMGEQAIISSRLWKIQQAIEVESNLLSISRELKAATMKKLFAEGLNGERQKETEIGLLPESWSLHSFEELREFLQYGTSEKCHLTKKGLPVLRIPNVIGGKIDVEELKYLDADSKSINNFSLSSGLLFQAFSLIILNNMLNIKIMHCCKEDRHCLKEPRKRVATALNLQIAHLQVTRMFRMRNTITHRGCISHFFPAYIGEINISRTFKKFGRSSKRKFEIRNYF